MKITLQNLRKIKKIKKPTHCITVLSVMMALLPLQSSFANVAVDQINQQLKTHTVQSRATDKNHQTPQVIQDLQQDYEFIFFYRSNCPHCHKFAPTLKSFAQHYHIDVVSYSTDGLPLDGFKGKKMTADDYRQYFLQGGFQAVTPALFLQNKYTDQVYPVLFGEAQPYELAQRINELMTHIEEQDNGN